MKNYTDLEQSKKLEEILPIESADCFWDYDEMQKFHRISWFEDGYNKESQLMLNENNVCAWSLSALLELIPNWQMQTQDNGIGILFGCKECIKIIDADTPIDAAFQMVRWLKENWKL